MKVNRTHQLLLDNIVFIAGSGNLVQNNRIGSDCHNSTFLGSTYYNQFGNGCYYLFSHSGMHGNMIENNCGGLILGGGFSYSTIHHNVSGLRIGEGISHAVVLSGTYSQPDTIVPFEQGKIYTQFAGINPKTEQLEVWQPVNSNTVVGAINELLASVQAITPHTVTVQIDGKGSCKFEYNGLTAYGNSVVVPNGSMVKITLIPDTTLGEDYVEWRNADGSTETTTVSKTITVSSDTTLYAYTALSSYTFSGTIQTREQLEVLPWGMNIKHLVYPRTVNPESTATFMPPFSGKKIQSQNVTYRLFRYTSGNADEGSQFTYTFAIKDFVEAWKGYFIWHTNSEALSQLEFEDVKFADAPKDSQWVEYKLESNSNTDVISTQIATTIYGTLEDGRKTMGFASGKVWYPSENGNPLPAWRCVFAMRPA